MIKKERTHKAGDLVCPRRPRGGRPAASVWLYDNNPDLTIDIETLTHPLTVGIIVEQVDHSNFVRLLTQQGQLGWADTSRLRILTT